MRRPACALVLTVVVAVGVLASAASATIVPGVGMAGIKLGMKEARVRQVLGDPLRVITGTNDFGSYRELVYPYRVRVSLQGADAVTAVTTRGVRHRTAGGAGVGSTEAEVLAAHPAAVCETFGGLRSCHIGRLEPGRRVTDFHLRQGKVVRVVVGIVID